MAFLDVLAQAVNGFSGCAAPSLPDKTSRDKLLATCLKLQQQACHSSCHYVTRICLVNGVYNEDTNEVIDSDQERTSADDFKT